MEKMMQKERLSRSRIWLYYTLIFVCASIVIFMPFLVFRRTLIWNSDGYLQWYAVLAKVKHVALDFLNGKGFSFWSWDTGLGSDLLGNYALVLCDPFSYLTIFFPDKDLDLAYSIIVVLKMYFAGMAVLGFTRYHHKKDWTCLLCATGYAFCAWAIVCLRHDFFMNQLILFPLLIWGVDRVDDRKSPVLLILSIMASVITSLYFSYMSAFFVAIYIILKYFLCVKDKTARSFLLRMLRFIMYSVIGGVFLAGPVLFPVLTSLLQASTGNGMDIQLLPNLKQLLRFIPALAGTGDVNANYSVLGTNALFISMIPAMLLLWKKKKISFYMFFLSAIFVIVPAIQSVLNGFSYASGRWCYVFCFFFVFAVSDCIESEVIQTDKYRKYTMIWFGFILVVSLVASMIFKAISQTEFMVVVLDLLFGVFIVNCVKKEDSKEISKKHHWKNYKCVFGAALLNIVLLPVVAFHPFFGNGISVYMTHGACYEIYQSTALKAVSTIQDRDFYRVDTVDHPGNNNSVIREAHTPANTNIYWQASSVFEYLSTVDKRWMQFNQLLGNSAGSFRRVCVYSNDNRSRMDFLLGVKYFLSNDKHRTQSIYADFGFEEIIEENDVKVLQAPYEAGLGYVYDKIITEGDLQQYSPLQREQLLMQCVGLQEEDVEQTAVPRADLSSLILEEDVVPVSVYNENGENIQGKSFTISKGGETITLRPDKEIQNSEVYVVFKNFRKELLTPEKQWELQVGSGKAVDALGKYNFFVNNLSYTPYGNFSILISESTKNISKRMLNAEGEAQGIRDNIDYIVNLGYYDQFSGDVKCDFTNMGEYNFDSIEIVSVPVNGYQEQAANLSKNRLTVESNRGDYIKGSVNSETDGLLYLSILYNDGWKIYVDGVKMDKIYRVNTAFMGVELTAGEHDIELVYRPAGYPYTLILFVLGLVSTIICGMWFRKKEVRGRTMR